MNVTEQDPIMHAVRCQLRSDAQAQAVLNFGHMNSLHQDSQERFYDVMFQQIQCIGTFDLSCFYYCITGLHKKAYWPRLHVDADSYMQVYFHIYEAFTRLFVLHGFSGNAYLICSDESKQIAVFFSRQPHATISPERFAQQLDDCVNQAYTTYFPALQEPLCNTTALSDPLSGTTGFRQGYLQCRRLKDLSFFQMQRGVKSEQMLRKMENHVDYRTVIDACRELCNAICDANADESNRRLHVLFDLLKYGFRFPLVHDALSFLRSEWQVHLCVYGLEHAFDLQTLCDVDSYLSVEECRDALSPLAQALCSAIAAQGRYISTAELAMYYIRTHCAQDITLGSIAAYVKANPNYLSGLFTRETGMTVKEYIKRARVERAQALLRGTSMHVYEIAESVGILDKKYFTRTFKSIVGLTPQKYRERSNTNT